jgi:hypothetical protein
MTSEELLKTLLPARKHAGEVWAMLVDVTDRLKDSSITVGDAGNRVADKLDDLEALNAILIDEPAAIEMERRGELDMTIFIVPKE